VDIEQLAKAVSDYENGRSSLDQFADWFRSASRSKFAQSPEVLNAILEIDSLFSRLDYEGLKEPEFRRELAIVVRPFVARKPIVLSQDPDEPVAAASARRKPFVVDANVTVFYAGAHHSANAKPVEFGGTLRKTASATSRVAPVYAQQA